MKSKISTKMLIEIERLVEAKKEGGILSYTSLSRLMHDNDIGCDILAQAIDLAIAMPKNEVEDAIEIYDASEPKMDELKFVQGLADKYQVNRGDVITRIQYVRRINNAIKRNGNGQ